MWNIISNISKINSMFKNCTDILLLRLPVNTVFDDKYNQYSLATIDISCEKGKKLLVNLLSKKLRDKEKKKKKSGKYFQLKR